LKSGRVLEVKEANLIDDCAMKSGVNAPDRSHGWPN
jgi:hypothetical protein